MPPVRVAAVHDLAEGEMKEVEVEGTTLLLANVGGTFYATSAFCTHYGAPLATGVLAGPKVVCPWHHAVFDVTSGGLEEPPALDGLTRVTTIVEGGEVFVELPEGGLGDGVAPHQGCVPAMADRDLDADPRTFVIVGGGAAGQAAAETLRQVGFRGRVVLVSDADARPIDRTKLSKAYLAGGADLDGLPLRPSGFFERHGIEVLTGRRVAKLDAEAKQLHFEGGGDGAAPEPLGYDAALVATGGTPRRLAIPGADLDGVFLLRSVEDAVRIVEAAEAGQSAVVIGSSFIGMEAAASLTKRGIEVAVVGIEEVPFERVLGRRVGEAFQQLHEEHGVTFHLEASAEKIEAPASEGGGLRVTLGDGTALDADFVVMGVGVTPATDFVDGVTRRDDGALVVDAHLRAGPDLYAAGDIAAYPEPRLGERVRIEHWRLAQQHGRIAARNMAGQAVPFRAVPYFWSGQFGTNLRYLGHASSWDEVIIDGSLDDREFVAYYAKGGRVLAAAGVKRDQDIAALHAHWMTGGTTSADEVRGAA